MFFLLDYTLTWLTILIGYKKSHFFLQYFFVFSNILELEK